MTEEFKPTDDEIYAMKAFAIVFSCVLVGVIALAAWVATL